MAYSNLTPDTLMTAGGYLGKIVDRLDSYEHPSSIRHHAWDSRQTAGLRPYVKYIQTPERQALINSVIDRFEKEVSPESDNFRWGVLQSDFNDANIIMDDKGAVAGVIDFGDSVYRYELASERSDATSHERP